MLQTRLVQPEDQEFLFALYATTRRDELQGWGWDEVMQQQFLKMQWHAQALSYEGLGPHGEHRVILFDAQSVGRLWVLRTSDEVRVVDMSLLPEVRNRGIGGILLRELQAESADSNRPLRLRVLKTNQARRLYERLEFSATGDDGVYVQMEWRPNGEKKS